MGEILVSLVESAPPQVFKGYVGQYAILRVDE